MNNVLEKIAYGFYWICHVFVSIIFLMAVTFTQHINLFYVLYFGILIIVSHPMLLERNITNIKSGSEIQRVFNNLGNYIFCVSNVYILTDLYFKYIKDYNSLEIWFYSIIYTIIMLFTITYLYTYATTNNLNKDLKNDF